MAFSRTELAQGDLGQGSNAPKVLSYRSTTDNKATITASGYFNDVADRLEVGDFIMIDGSDGMEVGGVATNNGTTVTLISVALS